MTKSAKTYELEEIITLATARSNRVGCPEVSLDDYGIVDYISVDIDSPNTVRCYELKISRSDFLSDNKKSFVGDFNYYVLPTELWGQVQGHIEPGVGVWLVDSRGRVSVKRNATKMECQMSRKRVMGKVLRALNRENLKHAEKSWKERQLAKRVSDAVGGPIEVGDVVEYRGDNYSVAAIDYSRDQMELTATCLLEPIEGSYGKTTSGVPPSIIRKVALSDIMNLEGDGDAEGNN